MVSGWLVIFPMILTNQPPTNIHINNNIYIYSISMNNNYRYQLERYRGRGSRYTCPQCGRKQSFTRYIDTYNIYAYIY